MGKEFKAWEREKKLIPIMIIKYCRGKHKEERKDKGIKGNELCEDCRFLMEYALCRLDKCPFKENKKFCSCCKIHCYKPEMKEKIKLVMKYSGPRMLFAHPIFSISHVIQMVKYKKMLKEKENTINDR